MIILTLAYIFLQFMFFALICSTSGFGGLGLHLFDPDRIFLEGMPHPWNWVFVVAMHVLFAPFAIIYWVSIAYADTSRKK